ncbi:hypothetical protein BJP22_17415 [Aeromonas veronii]|nr:hypothetical protein BJP22_17415 [Aeromonas veronii]
MLMLTVQWLRLFAKMKMLSLVNNQDRTTKALLLKLLTGQQFLQFEIVFLNAEVAHSFSLQIFVRIDYLYN